MASLPPHVAEQIDNLCMVHVCTCLVGHVVPSPPQTPHLSSIEDERSFKSHPTFSQVPVRHSRSSPLQHKIIVIHHLSNEISNKYGNMKINIPPARKSIVKFEV